MLEGLKPPKSDKPCAVISLANAMSESDREIFLDAVKDVSVWTSNSLSKALRERGVIIADHTITKHRNRTCVCYRS
jgi:hypothetical protein